MLLAASSSKLILKLSSPAQGLFQITTVVAVGEMSENLRSCTQVCTPISPITFKSVIVIELGMFKVEVIVGVPVAEIDFGTSVLIKETQFRVLKVKVVDQLLFPQRFCPRTLQ